MPYPEIPSIPPIEICNGCSEADILGFINDTNQERTNSVIPACQLLSFAETHNAPEGVTDELTQTLNRARQVLEHEKVAVERINSLECSPGEFCARIIAYSADGGVYFGQSYRKPPLSDLDEALPPESS